MKIPAIVALLFVGHCVLAQEVLPLYAGDIPDSIEAPNEETIRDPKEQYPFLLNVSRPTLAVYLPAIPDAKHTAVIILPGGSYRGVSIVKEGRDVALEFNKLGIAAFVLKYRTPSERHMRDRTLGPLQDVQRAIRVVREGEKQWRVDPQRVGLVGFSAGGHLAATAATQLGRSAIDKKIPDARPNFLVLLYPVISMTDPLAHSLSRASLLGDAPSPEAIKRYSLEFAVSAQTPPTFLVHAADDKTVNVTNTIKFFEALQAQKIDAELHIYPHGGHGFGLNNPTTTDRWMERCRAWLLSGDWLSKSGN